MLCPDAGMQQLHALGNSGCYHIQIVVNVELLNIMPCNSKVSAVNTTLLEQLIFHLGACPLQSPPCFCSNPYMTAPYLYELCEQDIVECVVNFKQCLNIALILYSYGLGICDLIHIRLHSTPRVPVYVQ